MSNIVTIGSTTLFTDEMVEVNGQNIPTDKIAIAEKYTIWSWYDVMTAFYEIGYQPTELEEERIKKSLFLKKLKHLIKDL